MHIKLDVNFKPLNNFFHNFFTVSNLTGMLIALCIIFIAVCIIYKYLSK